MFSKITATLAAVLIAGAMSLSSPAHAGCGGGHKGFFKSNASHSYAAKKRKARIAALKRAKARKLAAKKAKAAKIAKARKAKALKVAAAKRAKAKAAKLAALKTEGTFVEATSTAAALTKSKLPVEPQDDAVKAEAEKVAQLDQPQKDDTADTCKRFVPAIGTTVTVDCE